MCSDKTGTATTPSSLSDAERLGAEQSRYEVLQEEGTGLFRVRDRDTDAIRALHVLREPVKDLETRVAALQALDHPNIVAVYEVVGSEGLRYVVTEYVEGRSLSEVRLPPRGALRVVEQVCAALGAAQDAGVPLGAVAAESIRIDAEGHARIAVPLLREEKLDLRTLADTLRRTLGGGEAEKKQRVQTPAPSHARAKPHLRIGKGNEKLVVVMIAAAVILLASFLPWAHVSLTHSGEHLSGWGSGWTTGITHQGGTVLPNWLALVVGILLGLFALGQGWMKVPAPWLVYLGAASYGAVHVLVWTIFVLGLDSPANESVEIGIGTVLALLAFLAMVVAALFMRPKPEARPRRPVSARVRRIRKSRR